jgi:hypothetical protein
MFASESSGEKNRSMSNEEQQWEDRMISLLSANLFALVGIVPIFAIILIPFLYLHGRGAIGRGAAWLAAHVLLTVVIFVLSIAVHEGLHVLGWMLFAHVPLSRVKIGMKMATPYVSVKVPGDQLVRDHPDKAGCLVLVSD